jgi:hypothetical protein
MSGPPATTPMSREVSPACGSLASGQTVIIRCAPGILPLLASCQPFAQLRPAATATEYGMKGMEGGAVAPPAAIANAVRDALSALGAPAGIEVNVCEALIPTAFNRER